MRRVYRKKRSYGFIVPFLIFIGIGIALALGFQVWKSWQGAQGDVVFYVATGRAEILLDGEKEWSKAYSGTKLLVGDSLKTQPGGRLVLKFFNGTLVRIGENSEITLEDVHQNGGSEKIVFELKRGKAWINKMKSETATDSTLEVKTAHMIIHDKGTIFEVEKTIEESVKVMEGMVVVDILLDDEGKTRIVDTEEVRVGQELDVNEAILRAYRNNEQPTVILAQRDDFRNSAWYAWNSAEDKSPTDYSNKDVISSDLEDNPSGNDSGSSSNTGENSSDDNEADTNSSNASENTSGNEDPSTSSTDNSTSSDESEITAPKLTDPSSNQITTTQNKLTVKGTVSSKTAKIIVKQVVGGKNEQYTLTKYKKGDTSFSYNISETLGNLKSGENTYNFHALDEEGNESAAATLKVTYDKPKTTITESLSAPKVLSFNGSSSSEITSDSVKIVGEIQGAEKVVVNGYTLTLFEPGSKTWVYNASVKNGNLKPGVNEYQVYGIGPEGNKSEVVKFSVTYNPPEQTSSEADSQNSSNSNTSTQENSSSNDSTSNTNSTSNESSSEGTTNSSETDSSAQGPV